MSEPVGSEVGTATPAGQNSGPNQSGGSSPAAVPDRRTVPGRRAGAVVLVKGLSEADQAAVETQLGRTPRGAYAVGWRCPCGKPGVVTTAPLLPDGAPFPTIYYLTCPRAVKLCSVLEAGQAMVEMNARLAADTELASAYARAHTAYLADRDRLAATLGQDVSPIAQVSAGGMPDRVKCLHALAAHSLAAGTGVNPLGDEVVAQLGNFWENPC